MEIKDPKHAEDVLVEITQNQKICELICDELCTWDFTDSENRLDARNINQLLSELDQTIFKQQSHTNTAALHWFVFNRIHDFCIGCLKEQFSDKDANFFEKSKLLSDADVSAQQFGADENYNIPLSAAIVELSVLDTYTTPREKMSCLCTAYDLMFAEIKAAMVGVISQSSDGENQIPIVDNKDVIAVIMVVVIKSKLVHVFTNLFYVKYFYPFVEQQTCCSIFESFEKAVDAIVKIKLEDLQPVATKMLKNVDLQEYMNITSSEEDKRKKKTLVDEANQRVLSLINKATFDE